MILILQYMSNTMEESLLVERGAGSKNVELRKENELYKTYN